jgi:hypothetical protein
VQKAALTATTFGAGAGIAAGDRLGIDVSRLSESVSILLVSDSATVISGSSAVVSDSAVVVSDGATVVISGSTVVAIVNGVSVEMTASVVDSLMAFGLTQ